jgi:hypothetical protein
MAAISATNPKYRVEQRELTIRDQQMMETLKAAQIFKLTTAEFQPFFLKITGFEHYANTKLLFNSFHSWEQERIIHKIEQFAQIGGMHIILAISSGQISSCFFSQENFIESCQALGGTLVSITCDNELTRLTQPVKISDPRGDSWPGVEITVTESVIPLLTKTLRENSKLAVAKKDGNHQIIRDLQTIRPGDVLIISEKVQLADHARHKAVTESQTAAMSGGAPSTFTWTVERAESFHPFFTACIPNPFRAIAFDSAKTSEVKHLMDSLKVEDSCGALVEHRGRLYLVDKKYKTFSMSPDFQERPESFPISANRSDVVILSMNQTSSYTQYSSEILSFLLMGLSVMVYDNAGKGLSTGLNTQLALMEVLEACGTYLKYQGFTERQMIFKGQCAGGPASAAAAARFSGAGFWGDQCPDGFPETVATKSREYMDSTNWVCRYLGISYITKLGARIGANLLLPSFSVSKALPDIKGPKIYTIGVQSTRGAGGDSLVPRDQQARLSAAAAVRYVPMSGGTHVVPWMDYAFDEIMTIFSDQDLCKSLIIGSLRSGAAPSAGGSPAPSAGGSPAPRGSPAPSAGGSPAPRGSPAPSAGGSPAPQGRPAPQ